MRRIVEIFLSFSAAASLSLVIAHPAPAADTFRKLKEKEIRAKLTGMEITDDAHWAYQYMRGGTIKIFSMGAKVTGTWEVKNGNLCFVGRPQDTDCFEVWLSGNKVKLHFAAYPDSLPIEGKLQKQTPRQ